MNPDTPQPSSSAAKRPPPNIKVCGIGSAGAGLIEQLARSNVAGVSLVLLHSDPGTLSAFSEVEKIHFDAKAMRVSNSMPDSARDPSASSPEDTVGRLKSLCTGVDVLMIVAGMGGVLGNALAHRLAALGRETGVFVMTFAVLPFDCEGNRRAELAQTGLKQVSEAADIVVCWPNQKCLGFINEGTSLLDTYTVPNRFLASCIRNVCRAFISEMAVGLSYLDLCRSILNYATGCFLAVAEAVGPNRTTEALEQLFAHPVVAGSNLLQTARSAAVCIMGGSSLAMTEVNRIMDQLQRWCRSTSLLMGAAIHEELGQTLVLTVLLAPGEMEAESPELSGQNLSADISEPHNRDRSGNDGIQLLEQSSDKKRNSRFLPPPPALPPEKMEQLLKQQARSTARARKVQASFRQTQLPLEILSKGRFDKSEPTIHKGEDLDVPTYIRRGVSLN